MGDNYKFNTKNKIANCNKNFYKFMNIVNFSSYIILEHIR